MFGSGLDNQRAVTVKSTFLQNREYLDLYYREAYTVVEMEAGPFCNAVYEIADADRYPAGEAVNFAKLPIDFGIIHYASDTPYTQARTLGARGLSYYGMDSTYASSRRDPAADPHAGGRHRPGVARRLTHRPTNQTLRSSASHSSASPSRTRSRSTGAWPMTTNQHMRSSPTSFDTTRTR